MSGISDAFDVYASDPMASRRQFQALAKGGDPRAQAAYALMLASGRGGGTDPATAFYWYNKAAARDHAVACYGLGAAYAEGRGVARDLSKAQEWYARAAELGDRDALWMSGILQADPEQAYALWRRAAARGHAAAMTCLGRVHAARGEEAIAAEWWLDAATAGDEDGVQALARVLPQVRAAAGTGPASAAWVAASFAAGTDPDEAARLLRVAADGGHGRACFRLAGTRGEGERREWLARGAAAGSEEARHALGDAVLGEDRAAAIGWYRAAATWGRPASLAALGIALLAGDEAERVEGLALLRRAALAGRANGMYRYALEIEETDPVEALRWLIDAAEAGQDGALDRAEALVATMSPDDVVRADQRTRSDGSIAEALLAARAGS